jgi:hypothetical protein
MTDESPPDKPTEPPPNHGKKGRGNRWVPTGEQRRQVKLLSAIGTPQEHIAKIVGVSEPTLRRACKLELAMGTIEANVQVSKTLFQQATHPKKPSIAAAIWWEKTRQGRTESSSRASEETPAKKQERKEAAQRVGGSGKLAPGRGPKLTVVR